MLNLKEHTKELRNFSAKLSPKTKLWIMGTVIIAICAFGLVLAYSVILMQSGIGQQVETPPAIDIYDQKLEHDMGISSNDYENRALYTTDNFVSDKIYIIKNINRNSYDMIYEKIEQITAKYKFEGDLMSTIIALERIMAFDLEEPGTTEDRLLLMSGIKDPEIYMHLFLKLTPQEQAMLISYEDVNVLPAYSYSSIISEEKECTIDNEYYHIIGSTKYYEVRLTYLGYELVVCMVDKGSLQIFDINNASKTLNGNTYN